jgi:aryl-alcohol dehydrogenase-like predicted oxidoreductase
MQYRQLGRTGVRVSAVCLGTMTFGQQNSEADGHAQMDYALDRGITLFDASELYPIPPKPETQGRTEEIIGTWLAARRTRDRVMIATKAIGRTKMTWLRKDGAPGRQSRAQLIEALEGSLRRLNTDYIDLYQLHWPDRPMRIFEGLDYVHKEGDSHAIEDILGVLAEFVAQGKVRFLGLSNETPWGVMTFLKAAETLGLPRIASIQNAFNLANRSFEIGLAEIFYREQVSLLGYSPARVTSRANMRTARCRQAPANCCSTGLDATRWATGRGRFRPMSRLRASMASTRRKWPAPSPPRGRSSPRPSSAPPRSTSSRPTSTAA